MKRTIEFNIEKDPKFRNYIRDCILNQVKSITREEIKNVIREMITAEAQVKIQNMVDDHFNKDRYSKRYFDGLMEDYLKVKGMDTLVRDTKLQEKLVDIFEKKIHDEIIDWVSVNRFQFTAQFKSATLEGRISK